MTGPGLLVFWYGLCEMDRKEVGSFDLDSFLFAFTRSEKTGA